jgi:hypothetical protein
MEHMYKWYTDVRKAVSRSLYCYVPQPEDTTDYVRPLAGRLGQQQVLRRLEYADRRHPCTVRLGADRHRLDWKAYLLSSGCNE